MNAYRVSGHQTEDRLLGKHDVVDGELTFVWNIHPHELYSNTQFWVKSDTGKSWPLEGFKYDVLRNYRRFDYSQIGKMEE